jgi:LmbE family N-acetylglucosaminyl deacetylase
MHVFLSPHLDDAILSCGGRINQLVQSGASVVIVTVMAGDPPDPLPDSPLIRELHQRWAVGENPVAIRREEDAAAAQHLGATCIHLPIPDCVYRTAGGSVLYPEGDEDLFGPVHSLDPAIEELQQQTLPHLQAVTHLYVPLGAGNHVDHQLVHRWALDQSQQNPAAALVFYAEYPYSRSPQALQDALARLEHYQLQRFDAYLLESDIIRKVEAIACYQSQISTFWESTDAMRQQIIEDMYNLGGGRPVEHAWLVRATEEIL